MEMAWLEDFLAILECGGFSRAAERRNVTQPALSRRVRALEQWVGTPLFDRSTHAVTLTPAGLRFRETARTCCDGSSLAGTPHWRPPTPHRKPCASHPPTPCR